MLTMAVTNNGWTARSYVEAVENLGEEWRCLAATDAEQALYLLSREAVETLLLTTCEASEKLLKALKQTPPMRPPFVLGEGELGLDGPLTNASGLMAWADAADREARLPVLLNGQIGAATALATQLLRTLGVPPGLRAWAFLPRACALAAMHPALLRDVSHGLYPLLARENGLSPGAVERRLRLAVESAWSRGSLVAMERFFGASVDPDRGKPTNREFLSRVAERILLTLSRMKGWNTPNFDKN